MYSPFQKGQRYFLANPPAMTGAVVAVVAGQSGYYLIESGKTEAEAQTIADNLNGGPLDPNVAEAALTGSMFGWDVPGANPDLWAAQGKRG